MLKFEEILIRIYREKTDSWMTIQHSVLIKTNFLVDLNTISDQVDIYVEAMFPEWEVCGFHQKYFMGRESEDT